MARTVRFHSTGGPEVLQIDDVEIPEPKAHEVRIRTGALGINRAEVDFRLGRYLVQPDFPQGIGYEASGTVESVGAEVRGLAEGDAVSVLPAFAFTEYAVHGELVVAPEHAVVKHPENLSWEEAAGLWMPFVTAYGGLIDIAELSEGDVVLLPAASSSVGLAAIQVANMVGAIPVAITRGASKKDALLSAGAAHVIVMEDDDLVAEVARLTDGRGARVVFDPIGGATFTDLVSATATRGVVVLYGLIEAEETTHLSIADALQKYLTIRGYQLFEITGDDERRQAAVDFIRRGAAEGHLAPKIDRVFDLDRIADAHEYMEQGGQVGKIIVTVP